MSLRLLLITATFAGAVWGQGLVMPAGTPLAVRLSTRVSTQTQRTGDLFSANLQKALFVRGREIAPRGASVKGIVADANKGGRVIGRAHLTLRLTSLRLANGREVPLTTSMIYRKARGTKRRDAVKIGGATGAGAAIGAVAGGGVGAGIGAGVGAVAGTGDVLLTRGAPAVFPSESRLVFRLQEPVRVE